MNQSPRVTPFHEKVTRHTASVQFHPLVLAGFDTYINLARLVDFTDFQFEPSGFTGPNVEYHITNVRHAGGYFAIFMPGGYPGPV